MKVGERKLLKEFCKECVIAQELMDTQLVLSQIHFEVSDYKVLVDAKSDKNQNPFLF